MTVADLLNVMIYHEEEHAEVLRAKIANPENPPQAH